MVLGHAFERRAAGARDPEAARRIGVLTATGLIVGENVWGVAHAALVYLTEREAPLVLPGRPGEGMALVAGLVSFAVVLGLLCRHTARAAQETG